MHSDDILIFLQSVILSIWMIDVSYVFSRKIEMKASYLF